MNAHQAAIDDKLWELQLACHRYKETDSLADWVLYAFTWYIDTGRATRRFVESFVRFPDNKLEHLIRHCLNGDRSNVGIIATAKRILEE